MTALDIPDHPPSRPSSDASGQLMPQTKAQHPTSSRQLSPTPPAALKLHIPEQSSLRIPPTPLPPLP